MRRYSPMQARFDAECARPQQSFSRCCPFMESHEQGGKLRAFGGGQGCQETALLFVQDLHGRDLGGTSGAGRVNQEGPPVAAGRFVDAARSESYTAPPCSCRYCAGRGH
jgi:hypothetical protein